MKFEFMDPSCHTQGKLIDSYSPEIVAHSVGSLKVCSWKYLFLSNTFKLIDWDNGKSMARRYWKNPPNPEGFGNTP